MAGEQAEESRLARLVHDLRYLVYTLVMGRTNIDIDEGLVRKARKLTRLKTKRQIVDKALELLVRSESRKAILHYYGRGIWKGDLKASRRNRV
jgi:Arc/MetJ family transcription regulator